MPFKARVLTDEKSVRARLIELDLTLEALLDVVRHYALAMNSQTDDHPTWSKGIGPAGEAVYALRSRLKAEGWTREEVKSFALTVHPRGELAINIAKGDEGTGDPLVNVSTTSEKGACTEFAVQANQFLLDLPVPDQPPSTSRPTWYLLVRKTFHGIRAEFSLPVGLVDKHISLWEERLMLPMISEDGEEPLVSGFEDDGFDIRISRKQ